MLLSTPANPVPGWAQGGYFEGSDGARLRYGVFPAQARPLKGTVVVLTGRNETIEKYYETARDFSRRGLGLATFDLRGQGRSGRMLRDPERGYIDDFSRYVDDLDRFFETVVLPDCPGPYYILGHSTGGLIALLALPGLANRVRRVVVSAPLLEFEGFPVSTRAISIITNVLFALGLGSLYVSGGPRRPRPFEGNALTSDVARYRRNTELADLHPALSLGGPTVGWVRAACRAIERVTDPDFSAAIRLPVLMLAAGRDTVVSAAAIERYGRSIRAASVVTIDGARHELFQEADYYREQALAAFDAFVPGTDPMV